MLTYILLGLAALVAAILLYAATRPDEFRLERSLRIEAPPAAIMPFLVDLRRWQAWSPWEKLDPAMRRSFGPNSAGLGARYEWDGRNNVGAGQMEIVLAEPERLRLKLDFLRPFKASNFAEFTLVPEGDATRVTWAMFGTNGYFHKLLGLICRPSMMHKIFDQGLADLRMQVLAQNPAERESVHVR